MDETAHGVGGDRRTVLSHTFETRGFSALSLGSGQSVGKYPD